MAHDAAIATIATAIRDEVSGGGRLGGAGGLAPSPPRHRLRGGTVNDVREFISTGGGGSDLADPGAGVTALSEADRHVAQQAAPAWEAARAWMSAPD